MGFRRKKRVKREKLGQFIAQAVTMADVLYPTDSRDEKKQWVIDLVNSQIDLPLLNEDQEKVVITLIIDVVEGLVKKKVSTLP
jgi:hypothetical protein